MLTFAIVAYGRESYAREINYAYIVFALAFAFERGIHTTSRQTAACRWLVSVDFEDGP